MEEHTNMPNVNETGEQPKRRAVTAESMAAKQRDISVSEFFAKNRHLLGFDNPRKALLTAVKEAVDNSLDACEEAGIVPETWVHIEAAGPNRYKIGVQDNGPGIVKKQIPLIFGKLLYGSKFHRLRMSRGQQGIGISAAGMYGMLTTGKPVKIISMTSEKKRAHYFEIQIDTRRNQPEIINRASAGAGGDQTPSVWDRTRAARDHAERQSRWNNVAISHHVFLSHQPGCCPADLRSREGPHASQSASHRTPGSRRALRCNSKHENPCAGKQLYFADQRGADSQGTPSSIAS